MRCTPLATRLSTMFRAMVTMAPPCRTARRRARSVRDAPDRLPEDGAQPGGFGPPRVRQVDLVVPAGRGEPVGRHELPVHPGDRRLLVVVGADVEHLHAEPLGELLEAHLLQGGEVLLLPACGLQRLGDDVLGDPVRLDDHHRPVPGRLLPRVEHLEVVGGPQPLERTDRVDPAEPGLRDRAHGVGGGEQRLHHRGVLRRGVRVPVTVGHEEAQGGDVDELEVAPGRVEVAAVLLDVVAVRHTAPSVAQNGSAGRGHRGIVVAMRTFTGADDLEGARFTDVSLARARFTRASLAGVVMRAVDVSGADIDAPWLLDGESTFLVNGADVAPLVEAELNRRCPGRAGRRATTPEGLRHAWAAVERTWEATLARVAAMPEGTTDVPVDGEWSFSQTLRHLIMATDTWLRG